MPKFIIKRQNILSLRSCLTDIYTSMNFIEELKWRGMIQDIMPGTEEHLLKSMTTAYVGIDPTADSLHIGHLVSVMMLRHFQRSGHKPIALVGGATGMIGDPSMKSNERNLLDEETLRKNQEGIKKQLSKFLDFNSKETNAAELVNNYDWMKDFTFLEFIRNIGKHITVNYMMSKDSVKKRLSGEGEGMSFTEFTYQLLQGYDFLHLYREKNCRLQMGGSDQWGNMTTGTELIRRMDSGEAFALTCPLIRKADGTKFGKTEKGNIWLDAEYTSPYRFLQFWLNVTDEDAKSYIRIFTMLDKTTIEAIEAEHAQAPERRLLQKTLGKELTCMVHSEDDYNKAIEASEILFGKSGSIKDLDEKTFLEVFDGVPQFEIKATEAENKTLVDIMTEAGIFKSKGELRRLIQGGGVSINDIKLTDAAMVFDLSTLIQGKYLLVKQGKKNFNILEVKN